MRLKRFLAPLFLLCTIFFLHSSAQAQRTILTIGDSNGASDIGWVHQLKKLRPQDSIYNYSISGNTLGFDNLGNEKLNTLKNIGDYLTDAQSKAGGKAIDDIVILLGTNDCKKVFEDQGDEVLENLRKLIHVLQVWKFPDDNKPEIYVVSPPPIGQDSLLLAKYQGGDERLRILLPGFLAIALKANCLYIDIYNELDPQFDQMHVDGIHLNEKGSRIAATSISRFLQNTTKIQWDDQEQKVWPDAFEVVEIPSSLDGEIQKAYFYKSKSQAPQPLIVSLHTWSGDYTQQDPLAAQILEQNWNFIHPNFRGVNNSPKAMGSKYAIQDIEDAIAFAAENAKVDLSNIHVIGASGGGYATLYTFMNSKHNIQTFSAWVPISDIEAWYYQSAGRKNKYATDILAATSQGDTVLNASEARSRSPLFMDTPTELREGSRLSIYAGIHDGYDGSVPVSQSIIFYNKVIRDFGAPDEQLISDDEIIDLLSMRSYPEKPDELLGERQVVFRRSYKNISLVLFEGRHEMLSEVALKLLAN
jgi:pimeloyl-ACP methyl ester carboxylesterase/lysophospholipase L1-like esterase